MINEIIWKNRFSLKFKMIPEAQKPEDYITEQQVDNALKSMNKGKAADVHGVTVTVEHLLQ